jgi:hypothetical protein
MFPNPISPVATFVTILKLKKRWRAEVCKAAVRLNVAMDYLTLYA